LSFFRVVVAQTHAIASFSNLFIVVFDICFVPGGYLFFLFLLFSWLLAFVFYFPLIFDFVFDF